MTTPPEPTLWDILTSTPTATDIGLEAVVRHAPDAIAVRVANGLEANFLHTSDGHLSVTTRNSTAQRHCILALRRFSVLAFLAFLMTLTPQEKPRGTIEWAWERMAQAGKGSTRWMNINPSVHQLLCPPLLKKPPVVLLTTAIRPETIQLYKSRNTDPHQWHTCILDLGGPDRPTTRRPWPCTIPHDASISEARRLVERQAIRCLMAELPPPLWVAPRLLV